MNRILALLALVARRPRTALRGAAEFRSDLTTSYDWPAIESYDAGRELAHAVTLRRFEESR